MLNCDKKMGLETDRYAFDTLDLRRLPKNVLFPVADRTILRKLGKLLRTFCLALLEICFMMDVVKRLTAQA